MEHDNRRASRVSRGKTLRHMYSELEEEEEEIDVEEGKWILMEFQMEIFFCSSANNCWKTLSSVLSLQHGVAGSGSYCCIFMNFFILSAPLRARDSVIKRIYSCFMKIVNSYFSITMIFPFSQFTFLALPWIALMLFCGVGCCCYVWMCLLVVHFSSSFDFTLHNMQNSFKSSSFLSALNLNISRERWKISYKSGC